MELKELLFQHTHNAYLKTEKVFEKSGADYEPSTQKIYGGFFALYSLIEEAGLEDEYHNWQDNHSE